MCNPQGRGTLTPGQTLGCRSLEGKLEKRRAELERADKRLASLAVVRPAYMDEYESLQAELQQLFGVYLERVRQDQQTHMLYYGHDAISILMNAMSSLCLGACQQLFMHSSCDIVCALILRPNLHTSPRSLCRLV